MENELRNAVRVTSSTRIRFKCKNCGECCRHVKEAVPVNSQDVFCLSKYLHDIGMDLSCTDQFLSRFATPALLDKCGYFVYFLNTVGEEDSCIFLKDNRCTVQGAKPLACRLYPFMVEPCASGAFRYLYSREREHHFRGPVVETRSWMRKYFFPENRTFLKLEYAKVGTIANLLRSIPEQRKTEALLQFHKLLYSAFDLNLPFLAQFQYNQEKLIDILSKMTYKNK